MRTTVGSRWRDRPALAACLAAALALALVGCRVAEPSPSRSPGAATTPATPGPPARPPTATAAGSASPSAPASTPPPEVLVGAGDIAVCGSDGDEATANLLDGIDGTVFVAGDGAYGSGTARQYRECFGSSWGRHLGRIRFMAPGNHDYRTEAAGGFVGYFGLVGRDRGGTWYSGELGAWHVIVLDSNCDHVGGCGSGSPQLDWLAADLASNEATCTVAIWHHPRFSSGAHGNDPSVGPFWRLLYDAGAEIVITGHDHDYERFAPQTPNAQPDPDRGIREFVVGTGGGELRGFDAPEPNSEVRHNDAHGVLRLELTAGGYSWGFVTVDGETADSGSGRCH